MKLSTRITREQIKGSDGCWLPLTFKVVEENDASEAKAYAEATVKFQKRCEAAEKLAFRWRLTALLIAVCFVWLVAQWPR